MIQHSRLTTNILVDMVENIGEANITLLQKLLKLSVMDK